MCLGIPMQVIETSPGSALCQSNQQYHQIDTMLVGEQAVGTWLLTFLNTAREVLTQEKAMEIKSALEAVELAMNGEADSGFDHLFSDLVNREPQLPDFLKEPGNKNKGEN